MNRKAWISAFTKKQVTSFNPLSGELLTTAAMTF